MNAPSVINLSSRYRIVSMWGGLICQRTALKKKMLIKQRPLSVNSNRICLSVCLWHICCKSELILFLFITRMFNQFSLKHAGNYTVPAGTICHIFIYDLHRRSDLYENPSVFNPDRSFLAREQCRASSLRLHTLQCWTQELYWLVA